MSKEVKARLLIANAHVEGRSGLSRDLARLGYSVRVTADLSRVKEWVASGEFDLLLLDVDLFDARQNGFDVLRNMVREHPDFPVLAMGAENTILSSLLAARFGARDYFAKPYSFGQLVAAIAQHVEAEIPVIGPIDGHLSKGQGSASVVGRSEAIQETVRKLSRAMQTKYPVLFVGESGSGKMTLARTLLGCTPSTKAILVAANADVSELVEKFRLAREGGHLILHRIDRFSEQLACHILPMLGQGEIRFVGTATAFRPDSGTYLHELMDTLGVLRIEIPPLHQRLEDIPELANAFLAQENFHNKHFAEDALVWLSFPGRLPNVRALRNMVLRAAVLGTRNVISAELLQQLHEHDLPNDGLASRSTQLVDQFMQTEASDEQVYRAFIGMVETPLLQAVMRKVQGNQVKAAQVLGINRNTLRKKLEELGVREKP